MLRYSLLIAILAVSCFSSVNAQYETPDGLPAKSDAKNGQVGYNDCGKRYGESNPNAMCQNIFVNSVQDFCIYAPSSVAKVSDVEGEVVSWCVKSGYGTRIIPPGTITGASFIKTPHYVQLSLVGDFTKVNVAPNDAGGELDAHGATNTQNPVGALVYSRSWTGSFQRTHEWHEFLGYNEASVRACNPAMDKQHDYCPNQYDTMGSYWNDPGQYEAGKFENCQADDGLIPGVYNGKRWKQGDQPVPPAHPPSRKYGCRNFNGLNGGRARLVPKMRRRSSFISKDGEEDEKALERELQSQRDDDDECYDPDDCPQKRDDDECYDPDDCPQ